jgi:hypothetical protein
MKHYLARLYYRDKDTLYLIDEGCGWDEETLVAPLRDRLKNNKNYMLAIMTYNVSSVKVINGEDYDRQCLQDGDQKYNNAGDVVAGGLHSAEHN